MHRSSSITRASEFFLNGASASSSSSSSSSRTGETDALPMYDPLSDFAKKEKLQMKFAENAVHIIPLVLVLCAAILWFCSNPDMEMVNKDVARVQGLTIDGDVDVTTSKTGLLSTPDPKDVDSLKQEKEFNPRRLSLS